MGFVSVQEAYMGFIGVHEAYVGFVGVQEAKMGFWQTDGRHSVLASETGGKEEEAVETSNVAAVVADEASVMV
ncbi:hypothetical protein AAVH_25627 [Aphelenchoides avenae]|nr:hypothetical protein AAVH_25627 [Aphelenchus avenae]